MCLSYQDKGIILVCYNEGWGARRISEKYGLPPTTIQNIINKIKNNESLESKASKSGRKRITDERTDRSILRTVLGSAEKRQKSSEAVCSELAAGGIEISARTVRRLLVQSDLGSHVAAKKPLLLKKNIQWRLGWAQKVISWNEQN